MKIGAYRVYFDGGERVLEMEIDERVARIPSEQKGIFDGLIFLGSDFEHDYSAVLPADPADGRPTDRVMRGFTDDPRVLEIFVTEIRPELRSEILGT